MLLVVVQLMYFFCISVMRMLFFLCDVVMRFCACCLMWHEFDSGFLALCFLHSILLAWFWSSAVYEFLQIIEFIRSNAHETMKSNVRIVLFFSCQKLSVFSFSFISCGHYFSMECFMNHEDDQTVPFRACSELLSHTLITSRHHA